MMEYKWLCLQASHLFLIAVETAACRTREQFQDLVDLGRSLLSLKTATRTICRRLGASRTVRSAQLFQRLPFPSLLRSPITTLIYIRALVLDRMRLLHQLLGRKQAPVTCTTFPAPLLLVIRRSQRRTLVSGPKSFVTDVPNPVLPYMSRTRIGTLHSQI